MESFGTTDYQCRCPNCENLMTPFHERDGSISYGCVECGRVMSQEKYAISMAFILPRTAEPALLW